MTHFGALRLRPETAADEAFLSALHASVKGAEFALLQVTGTDRSRLVDMQFRAMSLSYRAAFPEGHFEVITLTDTPIGRLITDSREDRLHIVHIALLPEWRKRSIGTEVMTRVLDAPRTRGIRCEAIVAIGNVASLRLSG